MDAGLRERADELATQMAGQIRTQQDLSAMMRMMMKSVMERVLDAELDVHLGRRKLAVKDGTETSVAESSRSEEATAGHEPTDVSSGAPRNRRNGRSKKTVQGDMGEVTLATPRDRHGTFDSVCSAAFVLHPPSSVGGLSCLPSISGGFRALTRRSSRSLPRD